MSWDCLDGPENCDGEVIEYLALSGSGFRYPRCERHYAEYVERVQTKLDDTYRRYEWR